MISEMRSTIILAKMQEVAQPAPLTGTDITYVAIPNGTKRAKITPSRDVIFQNGQQIKLDLGDETHTALIRWIDHVDIFDSCYRDTYFPDGVTVRRETFRLVGVQDNDDKRWFLLLKLQLLNTT